MRGTTTPLLTGPFSLTIPDTAGPANLPSGASGSGLLDSLLPWNIGIDVFMTAVSYVGWNTLFVDTGCVYNGYMGSSGAQNDEINFDVALASGTWTFELIHVQSSNVGIYTVSLDGTSIGTIDGYSAGTTKNVRTQISGVVVATTGKRRLKLKMATKNASSGNYSGFIQHIQFKRTA